MCGSNKIANLPQSSSSASLNGTMSQANVFRMGQHRATTPPAFLAANAYATMWPKHTHIEWHYIHVCVCDCVVMALSFLAFVAACKIIHWERHTQINDSIYMYLCAYLCVCAYLSSICQFISFVVLLVLLVGSKKLKLIARVGVFCVFCLCFHIPNTYLFVKYYTLLYSLSRSCA